MIRPAHTRGRGDDAAAAAPADSATYRIRVEGVVESRWARDLCGMDVVVRSDGCTELTGSVADQSALLGVLRQLRDRDHRLVSVALET